METGLKRARPRRPPWVAIGLLAALLVSWEIHRWRSRSQAPGKGTVSELQSPRRSPDADGRSGDVVLTGPGGASLTFASHPDVPGHKPILGAIVDVATAAGDVPDPLISLKTLVVEGDKPRDLPFLIPQGMTCAEGFAGVRIAGSFGGGLTHQVCSADGGRFQVKTTVKELAGTAWLGDEIHVGSLPVVVEGEGAAWDKERDTRFIAFAHGGTAVLVEAPRMHVSRTFSHFGAETFPSPVLVRYGPERTVTRTLYVLRGDVLTALSHVDGATRLLEVSFGADRGGEVTIRDDAGRDLATGRLAKGETRVVKLPPGLGSHAELRDDRGVVTDPRVPLPAPGGSAVVRAAAPADGIVELSYDDGRGVPLPVHVLFKGLEGTADPRPVGAAGRTVSAGRSLYVTDGQTRVSLAPGRYRLTASHGTSFTLSVKEIAVAAGAKVTVGDSLREVVDTSGWLSADFHLHSAPSMDSMVTLAERVQSLVCEGVDLAVATDHNRITDLGPDVRALRQENRLATLPGVEISSVNEKWGHFNAFPLPVPAGAPEDGVPFYYGKRPAEMFDSARQLGARILQVNHVRMEPAIGYFDLVHLDPRTGKADPIFAGGFDVLEAFNGLWLETRVKIREGPRDLVALARRGHKVAATGNSDSHRLLYQEAGYPRTWVHTPRDPSATRGERALTALLARDTTVSSGPFVEMTVDGKGIGSVVVPGPTGVVRVHVKVSAPAWVPVEHVEVWHDDVVAERFAVEGAPVDGVRFERDVDVKIAGKDAAILAWAEAAAPLPDVVPYAHPLAVGFTGLVYVDGDGDGKVTVPEGAVAAP